MKDIPTRNRNLAKVNIWLLAALLQGDWKYNGKPISVLKMEEAERARYILAHNLDQSYVLVMV